MANANLGLAAKAETVSLPSDSHDHNHDHGSHDHAHSHSRALAGRAAAPAIPRSYRSSMFLASAIERLVIAVVLVGLLWLGIVWAVS